MRPSDVYAPSNAYMYLTAWLSCRIAQIRFSSRIKHVEVARLLRVLFARLRTGVVSPVAQGVRSGAIESTKSATRHKLETDLMQVIPVVPDLITEVGQ